MSDSAGREALPLLQHVHRLCRGAAMLLLCSLCCACGMSARTRRPAEGPSGAATVSVVTVPNPLLAAPHFAPSGEHYQLLLRFNILNGKKAPVTIRRVRLVNERAGRILSSQYIEPPLLRQRLRALPWIVVRDRQTFAAAHRWHKVLLRPKGDTVVPARGGASLAQRLSFPRAAELPDRIRCSVVYDGGVAQVAVTVERYQQRTPLRLPFTGRWQVLAGHRFDEPHSTLHLLSQSFAYDFGKPGPWSNTRRSSRRANTRFQAYGRPILAAAPGVVVVVHDGMADGSDGKRHRGGWQRWLGRPRGLAGNHVVLRHGDTSSREYSAYLHLRAGLQVTPGQRVQAGQQLGLCGSSGNSAQPHLHFQLQDGPDPLTAKGLPARFSDFSAHYGHLTIYVPFERPTALPHRVSLQPGRTDGAVDLQELPAWR